MLDPTVKNRIQKISDVLNEWLDPTKPLADLPLYPAIKKTANEQLFPLHDIIHQLQTLRATLKKTDLLRWAEKNSLTTPSQPKTIFAIHAGNLPLVGIQDMLAILLSGHRYAGKGSSKDPYLPASLVQMFIQHGLMSEGAFSLDLDSFRGLEADGLLFAGSSESVKRLENRLESLAIVQKKAPRLLRVSHFSVAYLGNDILDLMHDPVPSEADAEMQTDDPMMLSEADTRTATGRDKQESSPLREEVMVELVESMFRYQGNGCRSVGMVVSPWSLQEVSCMLQDVADLWRIRQENISARQHVHLQDNTQASMSAYRQALNYRYAYLRTRELHEYAGTRRESGKSELIYLDTVLIREVPVVPMTQKDPKSAGVMSETYLLDESILPELPGEVIWVQGGLEVLHHIINQHAADIQAVYFPSLSSTTLSADQVYEKRRFWEEDNRGDRLEHNDDHEYNNGHEHNDRDGNTKSSKRTITPEPLSIAQKPPVDWKPDRIDPLLWIVHHLGE